jgi:superfamily I DNA/RNA helicase
MNYRSSPALVQIQHVIAQALDANAEATVSRAAPALSQDAAQTWVVESQEVESRQLAQWIAADMAARGTRPRDYAIIVRQKPDQFEAPLTEELRACGIGLRNESKQIGRTTLQDLLAEELTSLALALLELATKRQAPSAWTTLSSAMQRLRSVDPEDHAGSRAVEDELTEFISSLAQSIQATPVSPDAARELVGKVLAFLDLPSLARAYPVYAGGDSLAIAAEAFALHWEACALATPSWTDVLSIFSGLDLVPLMTVHKSKGLEYDTVLFLGLDDNLWWSHRAGDKDGLATFFVALSRAKQRVIFTYCPARGKREKVSDLYALLVSAGVPERTVGERPAQSAG